MPTLLDRAGIVELAGADALAFAQAQFSSDVAALPEGAWHWSAWLDAQGRVRYLFALLHPQPGQLLAWLPRGLATDMARELTRFVFRAKVAIRTIEDAHLFESEPIDSAPGKLVSQRNGWAIEIPGAPTRVALLATGGTSAEADALQFGRWRLADVHAGLPWIDSATAGQFTPQALGLDILGAISLGKGCYPGQEVVARLHYRGGNKRGCFKVKVDDPVAPIPGARVLSSPDGAPMGSILHAAHSDQEHCHALAVLPIERGAQDRLVLASGADVEVVDTAH